MRRVHNSDIEFKLDKKIINVTNFSMKFYTVNPDNFYVRKTNDDVYEKERPVTIEDVEAIESGLTSVTEYYVALDWAELENIGRGVMNYQAINNYNITSFVDLWYNNSVTRTTEYYIDSDIIFSDADGRNVIEKVDDLDKGLQKEIEDRISGDIALADRIDNIIEHLDSGGTIDPTKYYLKSETSGATQLSIAFDEKLDVSAYTPVDLNDYYTKDETSGATEISNALDVLSANVNTIIEDNERVIAGSLAEMNSKKLDASAYTPVDLSNYYTKEDTSGATELSIAFDEKQNVLVAGENITISGNVISATGGGGDMSNYYTKTEVDSALDEKLDASAYTPTDLSNYYNKTEVDSALDEKLDASAYTPTDLSNYYTKSETSGATEIANGLSAKLDASAYTPTDLSNYYTKSETSGATELSTALNSKASQSDLDTLSGSVTAHTSNTDIHVTVADKMAWNAKSDFSGDYNDLTNKPTIPTVPTSNTAFTNDAGYITSDAISGKADTSAVTESITAAISGKVDTSTYNAYTAATATEIGNKQTTLTAGTGIDITNNVIGVTGVVMSSSVTTAITSSSTDAQVPTAKAVYDIVGDINSVLNNI